jgi:serine phosphatase RsbU (regulator of sigma subunit)
VPRADNIVLSMARSVHFVGFVQASTHPLERATAPRVFRRLGCFRIVAECHGANALRGGDFYCASLGEAGRLAVVIGDACGHGADGAHLVSRLLPDMLKLAAPGTGPGRLLATFNRRVAAQIPVDRFVTATSVEIDPRSGFMTIANAGHVPTLLRRANGEVTPIARTTGPALGLLDHCLYAEERHALHPGDVLVFMTDGILEAIENDLVGMPTLRARLAHAPGKSRAIHESILELLRTRGTNGRIDDRTLVSVELLEQEATRLAS